jgi:hypothetical protein
MLKDGNMSGKVSRRYGNIVLLKVAVVIVPECVEERDPRQNTTNTFYKTWEFD